MEKKREAGRESSTEESAIDRELEAWKTELGRRIEMSQTGEDFVEFVKWFDEELHREEMQELPTSDFIRAIHRAMTFYKGQFLDAKTGKFPEKPDWEWLAAMFVFAAFDLA